jgi:hypothetical protein
MDNLTPITREEILINDEPLTPITREEKILAGEDLTPVTRREYFLKKYRHAGGDVMVEGLEVTANGTYTAPEGKAYSPVNVNVPMPENAYLLKEASGSLVSFADGADLPMPSFVCKIDAVQSGSGEPSPENIRPISGHTEVNAWVRGKNLLPNNLTTVTAFGITYVTQEDGSIIANGTSTGWANAQITTNLLLKGGERYTLSGSPNVNGAYITIVKANGESGSWSSTIYTPSITVSFNEDTLVNVRLSASSGTVFNNTIFKPMIHLATESDATYEPYSPQSQTIQVSWQTEAGEVYGGYVDLVSGELKVTHELVTYDGSNDENWGLNENYNLFNMSIPSNYRVEQTPSSNLFKGLEPQSASNLSTKENGSFALYSTFGGINIKTDVAADVADFKTYLNNNNMQVVYKLATPITYQLTPTQIKSLLGTNNAWCDTGDVDIEYFGKGAE